MVPVFKVVYFAYWPATEKLQSLDIIDGASRQLALSKPAKESLRADAVL
jgi:hypothetical protein